MPEKSIYKLFNIEKEEALAVFLFLFQSVFLGVFYGALDVSAQALFLDVYPASMIPKVYIISGVLGIIMTSLYTRLQSRIQFSRFAVYNLVTIVIIALMLSLGFLVLDKKILVWVIFIFFGPLCILSSLGFWGAVSRMFTLRQGKRIFGLVDSGQILGIIIAGFGSTLLLSFHFETRDLLYVSVFSIFLALVIQIVISRKFEFIAETRYEPAETVAEDSFFGLLKKKYVFFMAAFVGIAVVASFFVHYTFMSVTRDNYPDTTSFAKFLGAFGGTMMIFTLLVKTFVYGRLVKTYGLKIILILSPVVLSVFALAALILGKTMGYTSASANFILFFLIISLTKLMSKTLHDAVEVPSFKILYQSLNIRIRFSVQSRVDGTINEISALLSGLLLAGLVSLPFVKTIHFTYFLLAVLLVWLYLAARLYREYRGSLQASLAGYQKKEEGRPGYTLEESLDTGARFGPPPARIFALELARGLHLPVFQQDLALLKPESDKVSARYLEIVTPLIGLIVPGSRSAYGEKTGLLVSMEEQDVPKIERLAWSANPIDRIQAANSLQTADQNEKQGLLKTLLHDHDYQVRNAALLACGKSGITELIPVLIEHLNHPLCYSAAFNAICGMGEPALETLDIYFYKTGIEESTQRRIIRLFGRIGGDRAKKLLVNKLDYFSRSISLEAISELRLMKPELSPEEIRQVISALSAILGIMAWNLAARISLQETGKLPLLAQAIEKEIENNYDAVMDLMALAYDERSVMLVKENLDSGTREGSGYALELMELFVADEMKRFIFPVLEDNAPAEKLARLQDEYPVDKMNPQELLIALVNKSCNEISDYTKLVALASMLELDDAKITDDLTAHLFNPDESIAETSAFVMNKIDPGYFNRCLQRLDPKKMEELSERILRIQNDENESFVFLLQYLSKNSNFAALSGEMIRKLAVLAEYKVLKPDDQNPLNAEKYARSLVLVAKGSLKLGNEGEQVTTIDEGEAVWLFPYSLLNGDLFRFETQTGCNLYIFDGKRIESLVFDFPEFATALLALVGDQSKQLLVAKLMTAD